jgi:hypothetical protein
MTKTGSEKFQPLIALIFTDFTERKSRIFTNPLAERVLSSNFYKISSISEISGSDLPI